MQKVFIESRVGTISRVTRDSWSAEMKGSELYMPLINIFLTFIQNYSLMKNISGKLPIMQHSNIKLKVKNMLMRGM